MGNSKLSCLKGRQPRLSTIRLIFGWFELPPIWPENRMICEWLFLLHGVIGMAIAGLVIAHIGATLYHHFIRLRAVAGRHKGRVRKPPGDRSRSAGR
jgi:hypothetical protein